jgi:hypothetical protein
MAKDNMEICINGFPKLTEDSFVKYAFVLVETDLLQQRKIPSEQAPKPRLSGFVRGANFAEHHQFGSNIASPLIELMHQIKAYFIAAPDVLPVPEKAEIQTNCPAKGSQNEKVNVGVICQHGSKDEA